MHTIDNICSQNGCSRPRDVKPDGTLYANCAPCRKRRARNQRRARERLRPQGGCSRCAYRKRLPGDFLCARCRADRDDEKELRRIAAEIDAWAAPDREPVFKPSPEDCGVSRWNSRKPREATAAYWSPLPDPKPADPDSYRYHRRFRKC